MHVGEAEVAAGVAVGEAFVIEAEELQERGVQVVDVDLVLDGLEAERDRHLQIQEFMDLPNPRFLRRGCSTR